MSKLDLSFYIEDAEISASEIAIYLTRHVFHTVSEAQMEEMTEDILEAILECVGKKVIMARATTEWARVRDAWKKKYPPNHAGYYYCHLCGGWVHENEAELDHIVPKSVHQQGVNPNRDDNLRMAHAMPKFDPFGRRMCIGNQLKGSSQVESKTLEIAPPDEES